MIPGKPLSPAQVGAGLILLGQGVKLQDAALALGVRSASLDLGLWNHLGTPVSELLTQPRKRRKKYAPDF